MSIRDASKNCEERFARTHFPIRACDIANRDIRASGMEKWVKATARHSHNLSVYLATSAAPSAPAIVMPQEIFVVIRELRGLANRIAAELAQNIGFLAANPRWQRCEVIS